MELLGETSLCFGTSSWFPFVVVSFFWDPVFVMYHLRDIPFCRVLGCSACKSVCFGAAGNLISKSLHYDQ